jgi:TRAP-type C4-dicarboxylate transport system permease small subunit
MSSKPASNKRGIFSRYLSYIGNLAIAGMMLLTTADVVGRYFFNTPVLGAYEITEYLMLIMVFSFLALAQTDKVHISVDIVFNRLPAKLQTVLGRVNHALCLVMMIIVSWMGVHHALDLLKTGEASTLLKIPDYPFAIFLVLGCGFMCIEFFRDVFAPTSAKKEHEAS